MKKILGAIPMHTVLSATLGMLLILIMLAFIALFQQWSDRVVQQIRYESVHEPWRILEHR